MYPGEFAGFEEVQAKIDKILAAHRNGKRDEHTTRLNLRALFDGLDAKGQKQFFFWLGQLMVDEMAKPVFAPNDPVQPPCVLGVIIRVISEYGPVEKAYPLLFTKMSEYRASETVVQNWVRIISPVIVTSMNMWASRFRPTFLNTLKAYLLVYTSDQSKMLFGTRGLSEQLVASMKRIESQIEELELRSFEAQLQNSAQKVVTGSTQAVQEPDPLRDVLAHFNATTITDALRDAENHLRSEGQFDPHKAASMIRTSMDEIHRIIVERLARIKGVQYEGGESDKNRREFMRKQGLISVPEEKFFTAIYWLLSAGAVHQLIAPRETAILMHHTVSGYFVLLLRRLMDVEGIAAV